MKKGSFKYFLSTFLMVFAFVLIITVFTHANGNYFIATSINVSEKFSKEISIFLYKDKTFILGKYLIDVSALLLFPLFFTLIFYVADLLSNLLKSKKKKAQEKEKQKYDAFVDSIGNELNKTNLFNVEDFRHFRENDKFQECLKKLYQIYANGENENVNYPQVLRKFDKGTTEKRAIEYLVTYTERMRKVQEKNENLNKEEVKSDE